MKKLCWLRGYFLTFPPTLKRDTGALRGSRVIHYEIALERAAVTLGASRVGKGSAKAPRSNRDVAVDMSGHDPSNNERPP